jgi:hypothetical protein
MQPEDIIQAKEWQQLTEAERTAVEPLASTEGEYNVLKKMLLIALEDAGDVPFIEPSIQNELHGYLQKPAKKTRMIFRYAAAASLVAIAFTAFFLLQPKKTNPIATTPDKKSTEKIAYDTVDKKTLENIPAPENESTEIVKQEQPKPIQPEPTIIKDNITNSKNIAQINTSVSKNENLLAFVTEVY